MDVRREKDHEVERESGEEKETTKGRERAMREREREEQQGMTQEFLLGKMAERWHVREFGPGA